jgi:D-alanyl-D-alanine carboxypeptidase/D-alanyl-D-alanine-endopeptidase (penicillin-binding protein 4)
MAVRFFAAGLMVFSCLGRGAAGASSPAELSAALDAFVAQPRFAGAVWGIKVVSLGTRLTVYEHGADLRLSPASNSKLYAAALMLDTLGGDYRITTPLLATGLPDPAGVLHGDLIVAGRGDPSWNFRPGNREFWTVFDPFVAALRQAKVSRITGDLVADATWLREPPQGASWTLDDMDYDYGAEISAITLADNYVNVRVTPGSAPGQSCSVELLQPMSGLVVDNRATTGAADSERVVRLERLAGESTLHVFGSLPVGGKPELTEEPVPRPAEWFARALGEALRRSGIAVDGQVRAPRWPDSPPPASVPLGVIFSPPLRDMVTAFMKSSQNLETDLIFGHLGEKRRTDATARWVRSDELAVAALDDFLTRIGTPAGAVFFDEGSGLSRNNLTTAAATVNLLLAMTRRPEADSFLAALPTAGLDGTLRQRMRGTPAGGKVRAKTGSLRWANTLSGFVTTASGEKLAFSLMVNRHSAPPDHKSRADLDELAIMLAGYGQAR